MPQGAGDAPGQEEGCPQPSLAGEPHCYVGVVLGAGDVLPPAMEEPGRSPSPLTVVSARRTYLQRSLGLQLKNKLPSLFSWCFF